jgi:hypothetical protein
MTVEDQIAALLAQAEPLRALPDDEAEAKGLPALVEQINALRAEQAVVPSIYAAIEPVADVVEDDGPMHAASLALAGDDKALQELQQRNLKRGPGRPRKAD